MHQILINAVETTERLKQKLCKNAVYYAVFNAIPKEGGNLCKRESNNLGNVSFRSL